MSNTITTTANRVKKGGYWCEDATAITQAALDKHGLGWDTEIPVSWGFENLGLANTILALGSVNPRFQSRANTVVIKLMRELHRHAEELSKHVGFTFVNVRHWLGNPDRASSCKSQCTMWQDISRNMAQPANKAIADTFAILFSPPPHHIACIHASKLILFAASQILGDTAAKNIRIELIDFLRKELEA